MNRAVEAALIAIGLASAFTPPLRAQPVTPKAPSTTGAPKVSACSLVPKEEVKRHLPWLPALDGMPIEEESVGTSGSSCNYPSVFIQVLPFSQRTIDLAREKGGLEAIDGIGDEAYFHDNAGRYAELYVRVGPHLLTLQANADGDVEAVKPGALDLARALVAKLR